MINVKIKTPDGVFTNIRTKPNVNLLSLIQNSKISLNALCNGLGKCGKCKVKINKQKDKTSKLTDWELKTLKPNEIKEDYRLACQTWIFKDVEVEVPATSTPTNLKLTTMGYEPSVELETPIKKVHLKFDIKNFKNLRENMEAIKKKLRTLGYSDVEFHKGIKDVLLPLFDVSKGDVTVTIRDGEIIHVEIGDRKQDNFGFTIDLGTTQLTLFIINLNSGEIVGVKNELNSQIKFGADVISRLSYIVTKKDNLRNASETVVNQVNRMITEVAKKHSINKSNIYEGVAVGNTLMTHIFHNVDPYSLARYPYKPKMKKSVYKKASAFNIKLNLLSKIYTPPNIAGYMGSDIIADLIATGLHEFNSNSLLIDIGTNTEIILVCNGKAYGCSTPSGPSFEGEHIEYGMRAENGAIDNVFIDPHSLDLTYTTIGGKNPVGICGSGIIDLIAEGYKTGLIDNFGTIQKGKKNVISFKNMLAIQVSGQSDENKVVVTQKDIREIQKAKAAIQAGYMSLLKYANCNMDEVNTVYIGGAFGVNINLQSAKLMGLIPPVEDEKITFLGNLASSGARAILKNFEMKQVCERLSELIEYVELGTLVYFQKIWLDSLNIETSK